RLCFRLVESSLVRARVDCEKRIAFLHLGAVLKMALNNLPAHLRLHLYGLVRCTCADLVEVKRYVFRADFRYTRRTSRWRGCLNLADSVLKDPIGDERCQNNEKQVRP